MIELELVVIQLMEECSEVQKLCSKGLRFGFDHTIPEEKGTNRERLIGEIRDVLATITYLEKLGFFTVLETSETYEAIDVKLKKISKFLDYSRLRGILHEPYTAE